ncbi:GH36-type glycosyl hydrolase domain-containing protein [Cupriavidus alkaliphilus]|uniref:GH36-type glycosyl hydrolase domain-containing protein n=1 Tax=Cupriavidus alkaliphilus TaxID=942866 RepID=UPI00339D456C
MGDPGVCHARRGGQSRRTVLAAQQGRAYVVAGRRLPVRPHIGRGGWTWYTGAAGWMYRAGVEGILGILREGRQLVVVPPHSGLVVGFKATVNVTSTRYEISVETPWHCADGVSQARPWRRRHPLRGRPHALPPGRGAHIC